MKEVRKVHFLLNVELITNQNSVFLINSDEAPATEAMEHTKSSQRCLLTTLKARQFISSHHSSKCQT